MDRAAPAGLVYIEDEVGYGSGLPDGLVDGEGDGDGVASLEPERSGLNRATGEPL